MVGTAAVVDSSCHCGERVALFVENAFSNIPPVTPPRVWMV